MNKAVAVGALLAAVSIFYVEAYDFKDTEFNQVLAQDLEDLYDSYIPPSHPRSRRDEEAALDKDNCRPHKRRGNFCCGDTVLNGFQDKEKETKKECFKEVFGKDKQEKPKFDHFRCEDVERHKKEMTCVIECVGKKHGLLDADGNLKVEEFGSYVKDGFASESWLAPLQDDIISTCVAEAGDVVSDASSCNPAGVKVVHCIFRQIQLKCPADQVKDEASCARLRERLNSKDGFFPLPEK